MKMTEYTTINRDTNDLIVRAGKSEDFMTIMKSLQAQKPQQNKFDDEEIELAERYTQEFCDNNIEFLKDYAKEDKGYLFRVFHKQEGSYLGGVIIKPIARDEFQWAEVGCWLLNQHWGKHYGSQMLETAIEIAFKDLGFHRLEGHVNRDNIASQKCAVRAGMELECIRKNFIYEDDAWTDNMIYVVDNENHIGI